MRTRTHFEPGSQLGMFLLLLMSADAAFVVVHLIRDYPPFLSDSLFSLETDRGFAEMFQYVKIYWIAMMLGVLWWRTRETVYCAWTALFLYLLADDSLEIHERGGHAITQRWNFQDAMGFKAQDFGELTTSAIVGFVFLAIILFAYSRSARDARNASRNLAFYLGVVVFFGIAMDMLHSVVDHAHGGWLLGVVEDGGEMFAVSIVCWYVLNLVERRGNAHVSLRQLIGSARSADRNALPPAAK